MKIEKTIYLHGIWDETLTYKNDAYIAGINWRAMGSKGEDYWGPIAVERTVTFEVPDDFDPRPGMAETLRKQKADLLAETEKKCMEFDFQISKLLALESK